MNSVPIPPPTDEVDRTTEYHRESKTLIKVVNNSLTNNNQKQVYIDISNKVIVVYYNFIPILRIPMITKIQI